MSIQQIIEPFCELLSELPFGIRPDETADLIDEAAPDIWEYVVRGPGPLPLPVAWQPTEKAQEDWMMGLTSAAKALLVTVLQSTVKLLLLLVPLLEQDSAKKTIKQKIVNTARALFMVPFYVPIDTLM